MDSDLRSAWPDGPWSNVVSGKECKETNEVPGKRYHISPETWHASVKHEPLQGDTSGCQALHMICELFNPKATERYIKVQNKTWFPFSFKTVEFLADVFSCNPLALDQRKYTLI